MQALIVDSDPLARDTVARLLRDVGCVRSIAVSSGDEALCCARANQSDLDLIVLDLELPDLDGFLACRRLSALLAGVPIIACCKRADSETLGKAYEAGAHDLVGKPFDEREVALRASAALRIREERTRRSLHEQRLVQWARQLEKSKRDLESTVCIDPLTGVANRRHFDSVLRAEWRRAMRDQTPLSLVFFDLDDFHAFNDRYGHVGGDACLAHVASALAHGLRRASDVLARYGGEELVAVLPDTDATGACAVAERLRARVEALDLPHAGSRCTTRVTVSAGAATRIPADGLTIEELVRAADAALFCAKREGRNCCRADAVDAQDIAVHRQPWPTCPVVELDPVLVQRVPRFLATARALTNQLRGADAKRAEACAQQLIRTARTLGLDAVVELSSHVAAAAERGDASGLVAAVEQLAWYVEHVHVVYRRAASKNCGA